MEKELTQTLNRVKYEPKVNLAPDIWRAIATHDRRVIRTKLLTFSMLGLLSLAGLVPVFEKLLSDLSHSGFYGYFSLLFSDLGSMALYWKEFASSLLESLPVVSILFTLTLVFVFFFSLKNVVKQTAKNQLLSA